MEEAVSDFDAEQARQTAAEARVYGAGHIIVIVDRDAEPTQSEPITLRCDAGYVPGRVMGARQRPGYAGGGFDVFVRVECDDIERLRVGP
jgi:hypothetical protein